MSEEISFTFNEPEGVVLAYGFLLLVMAFPIWKICHTRADSGGVWGFFFSRQGFPYLLIVLLGLTWLYWVVNTTYTGFWTLHVIDTDRLMLDYWFPRADRFVQSQNIRELTLVMTQKRSKKEVSNRQWAISLKMYRGTTYTSVPILHEAKAKRAITALERWAGRPHVHYLKDCSDPWGVVCSTSRQ